MSDTLTAAQRVAIARHPQRPNINDYIQALFTDFFEQKGDRLCGEDPAILGGIALYHGRPVTVIGTRKGKDLEENLKCNFGMPNPEGYRKALRLMRQAEKFGRPILTFIDTSGAYPGLEAEARGQGGGYRPEPDGDEPAHCPGHRPDHRRGEQRRRSGSRGGRPGPYVGERGIRHPVP